MKQVLSAVIVFSLLFSGGCILSTHHAKVKPGWSGHFIAGVRDESLDPPAGFAGWEYDDTEPGNASVQADFGYGKRFSEHQAFYTGLIVPLLVHDGSVISGIAATSLDVYWQFLGAPISAGVGGIAGMAVAGGYLEVGQTVYSGEKFDIELSAGVSREIYLLKDPAWRYFALASWEYRRMEFGFFADHLVADDKFKRCDEECYSNDYLDKSWTVGLMMGWKFD